GLVVQVHRPLVRDRLEQQSVLDAGAENGHHCLLSVNSLRGRRDYWQDSHWRRSIGSTGHATPSIISVSPSGEVTVEPITSRTVAPSGASAIGCSKVSVAAWSTASWASGAGLVSGNDVGGSWGCSLGAGASA